MEGITSSTVTLSNLVVSTRGPYDTDESPQIDASTLPVEVQNLWETMLRLDPTWRIEDWLRKRANEELNLVKANLTKERTKLEQRLGRVTALTELMRKQGRGIDEIKWNDPHQKNLFDIFSSDIKQKDEDEDVVEDEIDYEHPAATFLEYLPGSECDDPLMAIVAQLILVQLDDAAKANQLPLTLEEIGGALEENGVHPDEILEGLEWLLINGEIIEVEDDHFTPV